MGEKITIKTQELEISAKLNNTKTALAVADALPIKGKVARWGGEIYFTIPVKAELEKGAKDVVEDGQLAYWPTGKAFCIFFGLTPASKGYEIRAASPVNIVGRLLTHDHCTLWDVPEGADIMIEKA